MSCVGFCRTRGGQEYLLKKKGKKKKTKQRSLNKHRRRNGKRWEGAKARKGPDGHKVRGARAPRAALRHPSAGPGAAGGLRGPQAPPHSPGPALTWRRFQLFPAPGGASSGSTTRVTAARASAVSRAGGACAAPPLPSRRRGERQGNEPIACSNRTSPSRFPNQN